MANHRSKEINRKNKILGLILALIALITTAGAALWFYMYAPLLLR